MELRDGFVVGIFDYCDRWCETCGFTSHCRLFADMARLEASFDPSLKSLVEAPPLPQDAPASAPLWLRELIEEAAKVADQSLNNAECANYEPRMACEHRAIHATALAYRRCVQRWLKDRKANAHDDLEDPVSVISWFASLNSSKIFRALVGLADDDGDRDYPPDHDGSAKVALLGIERSHAAWLQLVAAGHLTSAAAEAPLAQLVWLREQIERVFPNARTFVRPGLDEPEEMARLESEMR